ncbi:family II 2-keto-3-deoxy-D-arabino-heptulosonate aldolase [Trichosporon asahii var. asahii CBS 2479]|uniref:Phospho-2-dehydro-3-deoxyheptonate aldolase n=1 Tax=Trichosporon asahii var. asahii (strain ATCC 90039 / CBS 2479 / JCM 2466 / KCTC 7840 / NBRC 103889/ NCYC 2677 / UAMH 7654) TaxID=1186058 RepID=J5TRF7_TRIAS|nr:family II 2-keto-3-deoxy-D-arabino-heptulosonate aldolase [Trichosporon asahii var. asahii CBS 2479]EJT52351.1 family II 2-keto-3-deoxy-D-arabino-heptulosonate aldolase [Trichosporon asahii var. asahii CBS 2479]
MATNNWTPSSWRDKPIAQDVTYEDKEELDRVLGKLRRLPPLVSTVELQKQLADVAAGKAFLLQGADDQAPIEHKLSFRLPVVRVMRIAGQYAKPRSKPTEMVEMEVTENVDGEPLTRIKREEVLSYRGDNVNGHSTNERAPDPERLLGAYFHSTATLNYIRTLLSSGFADLHRPLNWSFSHVRSPELQRAFASVVESLQDSLDFMKAATGGAGGSERGGTSTVNIFTSHEALLLEYEEAFTRPHGGAPAFSQPPTRASTPSGGRSTNAASNGTQPTKFYNQTSHFLWIGDRTRQIDGAHVEYFRGIANPIGIKVGPTMDPQELVRVLDIIDPDRIPGKVTVIGRYGAEKVEQYLPAHIEAVKGTDHCVVWQCDAMHGNTRTSSSDPSLKTRLFSDIVLEITRSLSIHAQHGTHLGGIHLELTGEVNDEGYSVTECIGGSMELADKDLGTNYRTHCDPRLNFEQSLDVAFLVADYLKARRRGEKPRDLFNNQ